MYYNYRTKDFENVNKTLDALTYAWIEGDVPRMKSILQEMLSAVEQCEKDRDRKYD